MIGSTMSSQEAKRIAGFLLAGVKIRHIVETFVVSMSTVYNVRSKISVREGIKRKLGVYA